MAPKFDDLVADLVAETQVLLGALASVGYKQWHRDTPADGWTIKDQIAHLAYFDNMNTLAARDPQAFVAKRAEALQDPVGIVDRAMAEMRGRTPQDVDAWFRASRDAMVEAFTALADGARVPWYGPDMSAASSLTARIMETWAHGHDVFDALDVAHPPSRALRNVAHICARTLPNSFRTRGRAVPDVDVRVELVAPDGSTWTWGSDTDERITGDALEFCLVGTQRRHVDDTDLLIQGDTARTWMEIAQAFAGPPGPGRPAVRRRP